MSARNLFHRMFEEAHPVRECDVCAALLADSDAEAHHRNWHVAETERWERSLRREDAR